MKKTFAAFATTLCFHSLLLAQESDSPRQQPDSPTQKRAAAAKGEESGQVRSWLENQDSDQDGRISREESTGLMKRFFNRNDRNKDGQLDRKELDQLAARLNQNNNRNRNRQYATDEQIRARVPEGVEVELNVAYREGNDAWKLDMAWPKERSKSPRPVVIFVHGGGWVGGDKRAGNFIGPALDYASDGYVTASVNYRLDREILPCVHDVKCAVRWIRANAERYHLDPDRIGAYGNSAGAHLVTMLGLSHTEPKLEGDGPWKEYSSVVQAVAASATPTLPRFGRSSEETKKLVAPINYVSADAPPILLFHDESDGTVPIANGDEFVKSLRDAGAKDVTYKRYTNESGHGVFSRNAKETVPLMKAFFARTLGHERDQAK